MQREALNWRAVASAVCLVLVCTAMVHAQGTAYGSDIKAAVSNLYATMRAIGGVIMAIGLGMCGFKIFFQHDTEHLKSAMLVSSAYHMRRIRLIAGRVFDARKYSISCNPARWQAPFTAADWLKKERRKIIISEYLKIGWFLVYGVIGSLLSC